MLFHFCLRHFTALHISNSYWDQIKISNLMSKNSKQIINSNMRIKNLANAKVTQITGSMVYLREWDNINKHAVQFKRKIRCIGWTSNVVHRCMQRENRNSDLFTPSYRMIHPLKFLALRWVRLVMVSLYTLSLL